MSEFYASDDFRDRKNFFTQYYSIMSCISLRISTIEAVTNRLKNYSGFGIETQIAHLNKCVTLLKDYKEDVRTEFYSLVKIVDTINDYENRANGILGGLFDEYSISEYENVASNNETSTNEEYSKMYEKILNIFNKLGKNFSKIIKSLLNLDFIDETKGISKEIKTAFSEVISPLFNGLDAINKVNKTISYFTDNDVSFLDIVSTLDNTISVFESALKMTEVIKNVKFFPSSAVPINETVKIGSKYIGEFTQYLPVANVILTTLISGVKTYEEVSADGEVSVTDWSEIAFDGSMDGLIVCGEALVCIACPPAAIGVGIFEIANLLVEHFNGTSIKDMAKEGVKKFGQAGGKWLNKLLGKTAYA